jgi:hypothetical protein
MYIGDNLTTVLILNVLLILVRLALSKLALKTKSKPRVRESATRNAAASSNNSKDSARQGPAIINGVGFFFGVWAWISICSSIRGNGVKKRWISRGDIHQSLTNIKPAAQRMIIGGISLEKIYVRKAGKCYHSSLTYQRLSNNY